MGLSNSKAKQVPTQLKSGDRCLIRCVTPLPDFTADKGNMKIVSLRYAVYRNVKFSHIIRCSLHDKMTISPLIEFPVVVHDTLENNWLVLRSDTVPLYLIGVPSIFVTDIKITQVNRKEDATLDAFKAYFDDASVIAMQDVASQPKDAAAPKLGPLVPGGPPPYVG